MKNLSLDAITEKLLPGKRLQAEETVQLSDPVTDTPMYITLEQLRPYDHNPRVARNPMFEDVKNSIRQRGLDQPPQITRRPGDVYVMIHNGGNTRLAILNELWQETRDERFFRIHCLFRPWTDETSPLIGHLAESDLHGPLSFIERALAVAKLKSLLESQGPELSQRDLSRRLTSCGYPISQPQLNRMFMTLEYLLPAIPQALYAGLGKSPIESLISLRSQAERTWNRYLGNPFLFADLWLKTLGSFDAFPEGFEVDQVRNELLEHMSRALGQTYRMLALEMMERPSDRTEPALPAPTTRPSTATANGDSQLTTTPPVSKPAHRVDAQGSQTETTETPIDSSEPQSRVQKIRALIQQQTTLASDQYSPIAPDATESSASLNPLDDWRIEPGPNDADQLRSLITELEQQLASLAGYADWLPESSSAAGLLEQSQNDDEQHPHVVAVQWLLNLLRDSPTPMEESRLSFTGWRQLLLGAHEHDPGPDCEPVPDIMLITLFRLVRYIRHLNDLTRPSHPL
jgi:ParB family protein of integrating conjugative element (PFGI_1 class)